MSVVEKNKDEAWRGGWLNGTEASVLSAIPDAWQHNHTTSASPLTPSLHTHTTPFSRLATALFCTSLA